MNPMGQPYYGKSGQMYPGTSQEDAPAAMWGIVEEMVEAFRDLDTNLIHLVEVANSLSAVVEDMRVSYNNAVAERDATYRKLQAADKHLRDVETVVRRYSGVRDPVIASDGFTYERANITQYLKECAMSKSKAYSQQTKEELSDMIVQNVSLNRLVNMLLSVGTCELPPLIDRAPIMPAQSSQGMNRGGSLPSASVPPTTTSAAVAPTPRSAGGHRTPAAANGAVSANPTSALPQAWAAAGEQETGANESVTAAAAGTVPSPTGQMLSPNAGSTSVSPAAPAGVNGNNANSNRRFEHSAGGGGTVSNAMGSGKYGKGGAHGGAKPTLHPCLRVYGLCNFMEDCTFANYPFEACLNYIKGKCRFGAHCKELHVDPRDPRYQNPKSYANTHGHTNGAAAGGGPVQASHATGADGNGKGAGTEESNAQGEGAATTTQETYPNANPNAEETAVHTEEAPGSVSAAVAAGGAGGEEDAALGSKPSSKATSPLETAKAKPAAGSTAEESMPAKEDGEETREE